MNNLGIIQGRLTEPIEGFQECPTDWKREFGLISELGLDHIEWIVTEKKLNGNPIFGKEVYEYRKKISSICCDFLVTEKIFDNNFLFKMLEPVCQTAIRNDIRRITIPLLENSDITEVTLREKAKNNFISLCENYPKIEFLFEIESNIKVLTDFLSAKENFGFTYDTGNLTSVGIDHKECIQRLGNRIKTVHLKDRDEKKQTRIPGEGLTDFRTIFEEIKKLDIRPSYTLQTAREQTGLETETIIKHRNYFIEKYGN